MKSAFITFLLLPAFLFALSPLPDFSVDYENCLIVAEGHLSEKEKSKLRISAQETTTGSFTESTPVKTKYFYRVELIINGRVKFNGKDIKPQKGTKRNSDGTKGEEYLYYEVYVQDGVQLNSSTVKETRTWYLYHSPLFERNRLVARHSISIKTASDYIEGYMVDPDINTK